MRLEKYKIGFSALFLLFIFFSFFSVVKTNASLIDELKDRIAGRNNELKDLQKEIDEYEAQIEKLGKEGNSLSNEIKKLKMTEKKLKADILYTESQIEKTGFGIDKLVFEIGQKQNDILNQKIIMSEMIRRMNENESQSMVEIALANDNFSDFFSDIERMENLQKSVGLNLNELNKLKEEFESQKNDKETEKIKLEALNSRYVDQKSLVVINQSKNSRLLNETKNKESNYQKLLADRLKKKNALEEEIKDFEDKLRVEIDPNSLPAVGSGVLKWPLDEVTITQYFGNTPFASKNPQVYNGGGHNGVDLRASIGTPVKAAKSGKVIGTGDTDKECAGVSYGKWVLIEHPNNLTTLYAHLSLIKATKGDDVTVGQIIGYSGDTGYSTGPHLHFTVYASKAVEVGTITSKVCGTKMTLPLAPREWYLNPLSYL